MTNHARRGLWRVLVTVSALLVAAILILAPASALSAFSVNGLLLEGEVGLGYDSNVYRQATDERSSAFLGFDLEASYRVVPSSASRFSTFLRARAAAYPSPDEEGGRNKYDLGIEYDHRLIGSDRTTLEVPSLDLELRGFAWSREGTYTSQITGEEIVEEEYGDSFALGDRLDYRVGGGAGELTFRFTTTTRCIGEFRALRRDYVEDYEDLPDVEPLDYDNWRWRFRVHQDLGRPLRLKLEYAFSGSDYTDRFARDLDGNEVADVTRSFRYTTIAAQLETRGQDWGGARLRVERKIREDQFQGYYDYDQWTVMPELRVAAIEPLVLEVSYRYIHRDYERAHVGHNPVRPKLENFLRRVEADLSYGIGATGAAFVHLIADNVDEMNPSYTYDRFQSWIGYRFAF